jgi:hypothetical protein
LKDRRGLAVYGNGGWAWHFWAVRAGWCHFGIYGICRDRARTRNAEGRVAEMCRVCGIAEAMTSDVIYQMWSLTRGCDALLLYSN